MKMIAIRPDVLQELPESCPKCPLEWCTIPMLRDGITYRKDSTKKRNKRCPLVEIEVE